MARLGPASYPMGYSIDWLSDGRLLVTGGKLRRQEPDGSLAVHADQAANEIVVDSRGNIYLNGADYSFVTQGGPPTPGYIKLVTLDGQVGQVADQIELPNGMAITPDNRTLVIAESLAGRLTAFDIEPDGGLHPGTPMASSTSATRRPSTPGLFAPRLPATRSNATISVAGSCDVIGDEGWPHPRRLTSMLECHRYVAGSAVFSWHGWGRPNPGGPSGRGRQSAKTTPRRAADHVPAGVQGRGQARSRRVRQRAEYLRTALHVV